MNSYIHKHQKTFFLKSLNLLVKCHPNNSSHNSFSIDKLVTKAQKIAGHSDFHNTDFLKPLKILLDSIESENELHAFGKVFTQEFITNLLVNRLELNHLWKEKPDILNQSIKKPLIIIGLPRSGTSFLFNLLSCDPAHRFLSNWETTVSQVPPAGDYTRMKDPRRKKGRSLIKLQNQLAPKLKQLHDFKLDGPEECTPILLQSFIDQSFAGIYNVPTYSKWLDNASFLNSYLHHKKVLQTLQWKHSSERWLLKSPNHTQDLKSLLQVYPDAKFIEVHREPAKCISSYASLCLAFRGIHSTRTDLKELGQQALSRLSYDYKKYKHQKDNSNPSQFIDLNYIDLTTDPIKTVKKVYQYFNLIFSKEFEINLTLFLAKDRKNKTPHQYSPEDFELTAEEINACFSNENNPHTTHPYHQLVSQ